MKARSTSGDLLAIEYRSDWFPFPVGDHNAMVELFANQRECFLAEAADTHVALEAAPDSRV